MPRFALSFQPSEGAGVERVPARLSLYLAFYGTASSFPGPDAEGTPLLTPVAYSLDGFEGYVDQLRRDLDKAVAAAREQWGR